MGRVVAVLNKEIDVTLFENPYAEVRQDFKLEQKNLSKLKAQLLLHNDKQVEHSIYSHYLIKISTKWEKYFPSLLT